jgi:hypothetical protein
MADPALKNRLINQTSANKSPQPVNFNTQINKCVGGSAHNYDQENPLLEKRLDDHEVNLIAGKRTMSMSSQLNREELIKDSLVKALKNTKAPVKITW